MCICDIYQYSHMFTLNSHWTYSNPYHLPSLFTSLFNSILHLWTLFIIQTFQLKIYHF